MGPTRARGDSDNNDEAGGVPGAGWTGRRRRGPPSFISCLASAVVGPTPLSNRPASPAECPAQPTPDAAIPSSDAVRILWLFLLQASPPRGWTPTGSYGHPSSAPCPRANTHLCLCVCHLLQRLWPRHLPLSQVMWSCDKGGSCDLERTNSCGAKEADGRHVAGRMCCRLSRRSISTKMAQGIQPPGNPG